MTKNQLQETLFNLAVAIILFIALKYSVGGWLLYSIDQQYGHSVPWHEMIIDVGIFVLVTGLFGWRMKSIMNPQATIMNPQIPQKSSQQRNMLAVWLMVGPTVLLGLAVLVSLVSNLVPDLPPADGEMFSQSPVVVKIAGVVSFVLGAIGFLTWLPGMIVGGVMLNRKK